MLESIIGLLILFGILSIPCIFVMSLFLFDRKEPNDIEITHLSETDKIIERIKIRNKDIDDSDIDECI